MKPLNPVLEISGLRVRRGRTLILDGISWRVDPGQHWVILGANGSGKTSLLSALAGYLMPSAGEISVLGCAYGRSDWRELRKQIGLVGPSVRRLMAGDEPALETVISGRYGMIDFWGRPRPRDRSDARAILRRVECAHLADRPWLVLSQGERQRVLIGRALIANPRLLILDEPCAGLDPAAREHFLQFLQRLGRRKSGPTLILVTHHVEEIMPVFSNVLVLRRGRVLAEGKKSAVLNGRILSAAFAVRLRLNAARGRYSLGAISRSNTIV